MKYVQKIRARAVLALAPVLLLGVFGIAPALASAAAPEFVGNTPVGFTSTALSSPEVLETIEGVKVECSGQTNTGTIENSKKDVVQVRFTGCKALGLPCKSPEGKNSEEIVVNANSYLVYAFHGSAKVVSDLLYPTSESFPPKQPSEGPDQLVEFTCGEIIPVNVRGSVLGSFDQGQLNEFRNDQTLTFSQTSGVQESGTTYEGPGGTRTAFLEANIASTGFKQAGQATIDKLTLSGGAEIEITG